MFDKIVGEGVAAAPTPEMVAVRDTIVQTGMRDTWRWPASPDDHYDDDPTYVPELDVWVDPHPCRLVHATAATGRRG
jgi:hypothetical protein